MRAPDRECDGRRAWRLVEDQPESRSGDAVFLARWLVVTECGTWLVGIAPSQDRFRMLVFQVAGNVEDPDADLSVNNPAVNATTFSAYGPSTAKRCGEMVVQYALAERPFETAAHHWVYRLSRSFQVIRR